MDDRRGPRLARHGAQEGAFALVALDKVYARAARLVQKTLDVEGVIVMDVAHGEVVETAAAEGIVSVIVHHADDDPGADREDQADSSLRPLRRRLARMARPARVRMRRRNPCTL